MGHKSGHEFSGAKGLTADLPMLREPSEVMAAMEEAELNDAQELAREYTGDAINALVEVATERESTPAARVSAAREILAQGWNSPAKRPPESNVAEGGIHLHLVQYVLNTGPEPKVEADGVLDAQYEIEAPMEAPEGVDIVMQAADAMGFEDTDDAA